MGVMGEVNRRIAVEEKGQRAAHTAHIFMQPKQDALCTSCGAVFINKRWYMDDAELKKAGNGASLLKIRCPACHLIADGTPAAIITLSGQYLKKHADVILDAVKNTESRSRQKNPLGRIMEIKQEQNAISITTTEDKLAQKLGREIHKAHGGELRYQWGHDENFVRVFWNRD
ncbi:BCAM0308 family protein [Geotalea sp. SG265]|uniref:BCAM0308 family protein n=1 Tax=Geotalea sp. SG265 TaxID=2922867 RepID=UPI001FAF3E51|nr:BCAM0308 family protein [Geotalea sp. SG265]